MIKKTFEQIRDKNKISHFCNLGHYLCPYCDNCMGLKKIKGVLYHFCAKCKCRRNYERMKRKR